MSKVFVPYEEFKTQYFDLNYFRGINQILGERNFESVLGFSEEMLDEYFTDLHGDSIYAYPINTPITTDTAIDFTQKIDRIIKRTVRANKFKYLAGLEVFAADYNPIENYNMTEKEASGLKVDKNKTKTGTDDGYKTVNSVRGSKVTETQVAPFDSSTYNNQQKVIEKYEGAENPGTTTAIEGHLTSESEPTNSKGTSLGETHSIGTDNNTVNDRVLTRAGNIGVTTTQQMLTQELELKRLNIIEELFSDIKKAICLSVY